DLRVLDDGPPLGRGERAGLGQDRVGDRELAEVVEEAGRSDALDVAVGQPERSPELGRQVGDEMRSATGPACSLGQRTQEVLAGCLERGSADLGCLVTRPGIDRRTGQPTELAEGSMRPHLVAAPLLRLVQGAVGLAEQPVDVEAPAPEVAGNADADRDLYLGLPAGRLDR